MESIPVLTVARFSDATYMENVEYRRKKHYDGCIYGVPRKISPNIKDLAILFVIEMNLTTKTISGIGLITNKLQRNINCRIYTNNRFNKYIYFSEFRIDAQDMNAFELGFLSLVGDKLFKTKSHIQRGVGITRIPLQNIQAMELSKPTHLDSNYDHIIAYIINMFKQRDQIIF